MAAYSQQQADFIATELPYAHFWQQVTGIPASIFLTQSAYETTWGTSWLFQNKHNPAGIGAPTSSTGNSYKDLNAAFADYAAKLMGHGEGGQQQFVADVKAKAGDQKLLQDLEAGPWAGGKYGGALVNGVRQPGTGLESLYNAAGLGQFDPLNAKAPAAGVPIPGSKFTPGSGVTIAPGGGLPSVNIPSPGGIAGDVGKAVVDAIAAALKPLAKPFENAAIRGALVLFGAIGILVALAILFKDESAASNAREQGRQGGEEERSEERELDPAQRSQPAPESPPAPKPASSSSTSKGSSSLPGGSVGGDVEATGEGAAAAVAG